MKVMFVVPSVFVSEPLGALQLVAVARAAGHDVRLTVLGLEDICECAEAWQPDVVAYSAMVTSAGAVAGADAQLRRFLAGQDRKVFRVMGGPHPTFAPEVLDELGLDAICQGDGDRAFPTLLSRLERGQSIEGIPNISLTGKGAVTRELVDDLDRLPFPDRSDYYRFVPAYRDMGLRSFSTSRGCPYDCSYCFNHAFNEMFKKCGRVVRRRSVGHVITEIEQVMGNYPPVRFVRFADDTFAHRADDWLEEFAREYSRQIRVPFYCLMRCNTLTEDTAGLLAKAGCRSIGMSLETGNQEARNVILSRNMSDETIAKAFAIARRYRLRTYTNTMLGIPGTTLKDDIESLEFTRRMRPSAATFTICSPYPGTRLWDLSVAKGLVDPAAEPGASYMDESMLNCYRPEEKRRQAKMCYLGPLYCFVPGILRPLLRLVMGSRISPKLCNRIGSLYTQYRLVTRIGPWALPRTPGSLLGFVRSWLGFFSPRGSPVRARVGAGTSEASESLPAQERDEARGASDQKKNAAPIVKLTSSMSPPRSAS